MDRRVKRFLVAIALLAASCGQPEDAAIQVLVGGTLQDGRSSAAIDHPVVVVEGGKISAAGTQAHTPVPRGSVKVDTTGLTIRPQAGSIIAPGEPANLEIVGSDGVVTRRMVGGVWQ